MSSLYIDMKPDGEIVAYDRMPPDPSAPLRGRVVANPGFGSNAPDPSTPLVPRSYAPREPSEGGFDVPPTIVEAIQDAFRPALRMAKKMSNDPVQRTIAAVVLALAAAAVVGYSTIDTPIPQPDKPAVTIEPQMPEAVPLAPSGKADGHPVRIKPGKSKFGR